METQKPNIINNKRKRDKETPSPCPQPHHDAVVVGSDHAQPMGKVMPSMDAVVKVFCTHTEPNYSLPWQRKRQYSSSSSGFLIGGKRVLTNAHSVQHFTQIKLKKRGSDTKFLATVLAIGTECDIGMPFQFTDFVFHELYNIDNVFMSWDLNVILVLVFILMDSCPFFS